MLDGSIYCKYISVISNNDILLSFFELIEKQLKRQFTKILRHDNNDN